MAFTLPATDAPVWHLGMYCRLVQRMIFNFESGCRLSYLVSQYAFVAIFLMDVFIEGLRLNYLDNK